ncbi:unnamed protein product [Lepidochelys kempii]
MQTFPEINVRAEFPFPHRNGCHVASCHQGPLDPAEPSLHIEDNWKVPSSCSSQHVLKEGSNGAQETQIQYLGHHLTKEGRTSDNSKIAAITEMAAPTCKAGLQRFLEKVTSLEKYIPNMATVATPLRQVLGKDVEFAWMPVR